MEVLAQPVTAVFGLAFLHLAVGIKLILVRKDAYDIGFRNVIIIVTLAEFFLLANTALEAIIDAVGIQLVELALRCMRIVIGAVLIKDVKNSRLEFLRPCLLAMLIFDTADVAWLITK
ncbi:MAG: hypothetical protein HYW27_03755 [Candidatus Aenigmarchaeota archaeon]|nr:hypothetical protein [Candidatus Aenigmarchaeota archaeon]